MVKIHSVEDHLIQKVKNVNGIIYFIEDFIEKYN